MTNTYPGYGSLKTFCLEHRMVQLKLERRLYFGEQKTLEAYMKLKEQYNCELAGARLDKFGQFCLIFSV